MKGSVRLEGGKELERELKEVEPKVAKKVVTKALRAGAKVILKAAKSAAPKRTGLLQRSLTVRAAKRKKGRVAFVVQTKGGDFKGKSFYAAFLEYGHKAGSRKLANRKIIPPQPFLSPAFDSAKDDAARTVVDTARFELASITK